MNPISLPIAELKPALAGLGKIINLKATLPVLHHIKVERTSDGWIALTATDLDRFVTMRLEHPAEGPPLAVLIPYDQLLQITKNCGKDERLYIEPGLIKFALASKLGESKVTSIPLEEFPHTPRIKADVIALSPELRRSIHEAMECASSDNTRYVLNGTFIDTSNPKANYIVGTDGKHLYSANSFALPLKNSVIIPNHKFLSWKEFNNDGEWQLKADVTTVQLASRRWRFVSRQIDGKYPDWRVTIPDARDAKAHIVIDPAKLDMLIKLIQRMPCHDPEKFQTIGLEWKQGQFMLLGKDNYNQPWTRVPFPDVIGEGREVTIFLSRRFLIKALDYGLNTISLMDQIDPLRFHNKGKQLIVMPLRPEGSNIEPPKPQQPAPVNLAPIEPLRPPSNPTKTHEHH